MAKQKFLTINDMKIATEDLQYFNEKPSYGFSAKKNQEVINRTIRKYKEYRAKKEAEYHEGIRERTDAVASYLKHLTSKDTPVEQYFGKKELARLQGRKIMSKIFTAANGQKAATLYEA